MIKCSLFSFSYVMPFLLAGAAVAPELPSSAQTPASSAAPPAVHSSPTIPAQTSRQDRPRPEETEFYQPAPPVVTPAAAVGMPPSDAIVLFDGKDLGQWVSAKDGTTPADWDVHDGVVTVRKGGVGNIQTRQKFKDYQLHVEWRVPAGIEGTGQGRGNSGIFLASTGPGDDGYELQVLDSYKNETYTNGMLGSLYKQSVPLANAARRPGEWSSYDIVWTAPRFNGDGTLKTPAFATAFENGVLVEDHFELKGQTLYIGQPFYKAYETAPIKLQAHGDKSEPISFRNIWLREVKHWDTAPHK
jgi:hypothetical protein